MNCAGGALEIQNIVMHHFAEFVLNHQPAGSTIDTLCILSLGLVLGWQACKSKIDAETLMWHLDSVRFKSVFSGRHFFEFSLDAYGALVKDGAQCTFSEFRNPIATFVTLGSDRW